MHVSTRNVRRMPSMVGVPVARSRRGVLTLWAAFVVLALGLVAMGTIRIVYRSNRLTDVRFAAESSALAAGHAYLSDDLLRSRQQAFEHDGRIARSQQAACEVCQLRNDPSLPHPESNDVQMEWPQEQDDKRHGLVPSRIHVHLDHPSLHDPFLSMIAATRNEVSATVALEHSPCGFRPTENGAVPILPFAICDDNAIENPVAGQSVSGGIWTTQIEKSGGRDEFSWNPETHEFTLGPDGIPEVCLKLDPSSPVTNGDSLIPISFGSTMSPEDWMNQIRSGLSLETLRESGIDAVMYPSTTTLMPLKAGQYGQVVSELRLKAGQPLILSLCSMNLSAGKSAVSFQLKRPVAARVVQISRSVPGTTRVYLQPCVLVTSTTVTSSAPEFADNRYIYSVRIDN